MEISSLLAMVLVMASMSEQTVLSTAQGKLRGVDRGGYVSYTGIPYASVASNHGRFKRAGIAPLWSGIRDSRESLCSPVSIEDCLQLEVHSPTATGSNWPVLVWVTGGAGPYNPGKIVDQGIIVVVVHHRQGPVGFLCIDDEQVPGNAGAKDVVIGLRWVRDNIVAFKGNPAKVVLAGQGYGAAMVEALTFSTMTHGLYQGVILQSGSVLCPWAFNYDAKERGLRLMEMMFSDVEDSAKILLETKIEDFVSNSDKLDVPYFPFGMCIDKPLKNEERLLSGAPYDLLLTKNYTVPMIIGYNDNEAYLFVSLLKETKVIKRMSRDIRFLLPDELKFLNEREQNQVARQVKYMYFRKNISMASVLAYHRDAYFSSHVHRSARLHTSASNAPVYYYQLSYSGDLGVQSDPGIEKVGAAHSDELVYLFNDEEYKGEDEIVQRKIIKLWTNFVKYLNPTPSRSEVTWDATRPDQLRVLDIGTEIRMIDYPHTKAAKMWDDIYDKHYYGKHRIAT